MKKEIAPKLIRMRDAFGYLGMCARVFNNDVRPYVREVRIGIQGIAFDRDELDSWAKNYFDSHSVAKPAIQDNNEVHVGRRYETRNQSWRVKILPDFINKMESGTLTRSSKAADFARVLELTRGKRQKSI